MLVHELTDHVGLSVKFMHRKLLVVLIMHHVKRFCHFLLKQKKQNQIAYPYSHGESFFFFLPPLEKRCFLSQDLSIIADIIIHTLHTVLYKFSWF